MAVVIDIFYLTLGIVLVGYWELIRHRELIQTIKIDGRENVELWRN